MIRRFLPVIVLCGLVTPLLAQPDHVKWGKVSEDDLRITAYEADSNASAVVLVDYGNVYFDSNYQIVMERYRRVKILTEAGYDWGTVDIPFLHENRRHRVRRIKGQTFVLGPNGKVKRHKMKGDAVFEEDIDGAWKRMKFTLPALEPGAVIEYRYKWVSKSPMFLPEWQFQYDEPVEWSGYTVEIPSNLGYVFLTRGTLMVPPQSSTPVTRPHGKGQIHRWTMSSIPALREEPFMTRPEDYRTRLSFQLKDYSIRGRYETVLGTWEELAEDVMNDSDFGRQLRGDRDVRRQVEAILADIDPADETARMIALYDYVRTHVEWNGKRRYFTESDVDDVLERKSGSSSELTFLLLNMLREADLQAHPVLISTRDHGQVVEAYPLVHQFNEVLAYVEAGGNEYLLSPTNPVRPYDVLPTRALNGRGWLVLDDAPRWIDVEATEEYGRTLFVQAALSADGALEGSLSTKEKGYSGVNKRRALRDEGDDDFFRKVLLDDLEGLRIDSQAVEYRDEVVEPLVTHADFSLPVYAQVAGDFIYVNPFVVGRVEENPLRLPERNFPVDMSYPRTHSYTISMQVPEGYVVNELPQNQRVQIPDGTAVYQRLCMEQNGFITVRSTLITKRAVYKPAVYTVLRGFYDEVVSAQAEPIVLQRAPESAAPKAATTDVVSDTEEEGGR